MTRGVTCKVGRQLLATGNSARQLFEMSAEELKELDCKLSPATIEHLLSHEGFVQAETEMAFIERNHITALCCNDERYPQRLNRKECTDTPFVLYYKGNADLNKKHIISMVGTRKATAYGQCMTERIVSELQGEDMLIVSGLAYGIDTAAHQSSLNHQLATVGVLGHGMDLLYPAQNRQLARSMVDGNGGLLTEYPSGTKMHPSLFPARNRIIAALSDATIVVEAAETGGALLTAGMASGYQRDVFAVPGRLDDEYSKGCNNLIADNKAFIIRGASDLGFIMGWKLNHTTTYTEQQQKLFTELSEQEQSIVTILQNEGEMTIDEIVTKSEQSLPKIATIMLSLELKMIVKCLAGKKYKVL